MHYECKELTPFHSECLVKSSDVCVESFAQCGGHAWKGATDCCQETFYCSHKNDFFSQCLPIIDSRVDALPMGEKPAEKGVEERREGGMDNTAKQAIEIFIAALLHVLLAGVLSTAYKRYKRRKEAKEAQAIVPVQKNLAAIELEVQDDVLPSPACMARVGKANGKARRGESTKEKLLAGRGASESASISAAHADEHR